MPEELRRLTADDDPAAWDLGRLAFGLDRTPPPGWGSARPGRRTWGVVDSTGRLLAKAVDREQHQWFGGRAVPTSGIAGVAVVPERRGTGLTRRVLTRLLADARDRGAVVSTLFRTTPLPYRRLGWEEVGSLRWTLVPTAALGGARPPEVDLRQAGPDDVAGVLTAYRDVARAGTGLMERSGPLFDTSTAAVLAGLEF